VQAIIRELRGEKIDIVEWSDDAVEFVTNALSPAKVQRVTIVDADEMVMEVVVEDKQLSLAIGKKGQNVRLAAKLSGWRIDIKSEEEKRKEVEAQLIGFEEEDGAAGEAEVEVGVGAGAEAGVLKLPGIHDEVVATLQQGGLTSAAAVEAAGKAGLVPLGFDEETIEAVLDAARSTNAESAPGEGVPADQEPGTEANE
jgi:N utilization substance protein A